jgi:quinol---cytochrome c reductase iron-sulfur subunit
MGRRLATAGRWIGRALVAAVLLALRRRAPERDERELPASRPAEALVAALLGASALASVATVVVYVAGADTQLLGIGFGLSLALIAAALIVAASRVVPQEEQAEERPRFAWPEGDRGRSEEDAAVARSGREVAAAADGVTRRRLLVAAGGTAGAALGAAIVVPLASLGPHVEGGLVTDQFQDGVRLVDEANRPIRAEEIEVGAFTTAFAEGASHDNEGAIAVVVRVHPDQLELPPERAGWAPEGFLAFSKICTHAGCAVNLYRSPLYPPQAPSPALVCPCHYSTFDVLQGGTRIFGPAGRPLPQLPLRIERGLLVAAGPFSGRIGPSWSGVRE